MLHLNIGLFKEPTGGSWPFQTMQHFLASMPTWCSCCAAGEPNTKDSLLIAGDKLPEYLAGAYTLGDALADLCEVPALKAQLMSASSSVRRRQQQQQQQPAQRALLASPFAQANAAVAAVAAGTASADEAGQPNGVSIPAGTGAAAVAAGAEEDEAAAAALAASVRVPRGFAIGSFSSKSLGQSGDSGSHPSLLQLLEREQQQQLSQGLSRGSEADPAAAAAVAAAGSEDDLRSGFADAYLDPPVPTADQLSLFTEVQRIVGRRRLRPVLHCKLHRMVFAMPFDDRIRITLDTDVQTTALVSYQSCYLLLNSAATVLQTLAFLSVLRYCRDPYGCVGAVCAGPGASHGSNGVASAAAPPAAVSAEHALRLRCTPSRIEHGALHGTCCCGCFFCCREQLACPAAAATCTQQQRWRQHGCSC
jgi:hypothetical protein